MDSTGKQPIRSISAVGIIYHEDNPAEVFFEMKDETHPDTTARGKLCPIGGNWLGPEAAADRGPFDTLAREIREELSLEEVVCSQKDRQGLEVVREVMIAMACRGEDCLQVMPTCTALVSYFGVAIWEGAWQKLARLQAAYGNLSRESSTCIMSLDQIIAEGKQMAFCHDRALQRFWLRQGLAQANELPLLPGFGSQELVDSYATYMDYLEHYEVAQKPI